MEIGEEDVSSCIISSCLVPPKCFNFNKYSRILMSNKIKGTMQYRIHCGSEAEFFVRPLISCIGDIDVMMYFKDRFCFSNGIPQLLFNGLDLPLIISCLKLESYNNYPGYVKLRVFGKYVYSWERKKYLFVRSETQNRYHAFLVKQKSSEASSDKHQRGVSFESQAPTVVTNLATSESYIEYFGPAQRIFHMEPGISIEHTDFVLSVVCFQWPEAASEWPARRRKHGWPSAAIIQRITQAGCHVVGARHHKCIHDVTQWRLSFSVAELTLFRTLDKDQQIVYHMLRYFAKTEFLNKDCTQNVDGTFFSTYCIKTLMMWTCEEYSSEWWKSQTLIAICCSMLCKLAQWMTMRHCPNYFIPRANLFNVDSDPVTIEATIRKLDYFNKPLKLSQWFAEKYITRLYHLIFRTKLDIVNFRHIQMCNAHINQYKRWYQFHCLDQNLCTIHFRCIGEVHLVMHYGNIHLENTLCNSHEIFSSTEKGSCIRYYSTAVIMLMLIDLICDNIMSCDNSIITTLIRAVIPRVKANTARLYTCQKNEMSLTKSSNFCLSQAEEFMGNITLSNSLHGFKFLLHVSKQLLIKSTEYNNLTISGSSTVAIYLAALHFADSKYENTRDVCLQIIRKYRQEPIKELSRSSNVLDANCLLFIQDVATCVGFLQLCGYASSKRDSQSQRCLVCNTSITPQIFAQYLCIESSRRLCESVEGVGPLTLSNDLLQMDACLTAITNNIISETAHPHDRKRKTWSGMFAHCDFQNSDSLHQLNVHEHILLQNDSLRETLAECALENINSAFSLIEENLDVRSDNCICYRAVRLYRQQKYADVLALCDFILNRPALAKNLKRFLFLNAVVLPPFHLLFDDDIQLLMAFQTLYCFSTPSNVYRHRINTNFIYTNGGLTNTSRLLGGLMLPPLSIEISLLYSATFLGEISETAMHNGQRTSFVGNCFGFCRYRWKTSV